MKNFLLFISIFLIISKLSAEIPSFPLSGLGALWGHTTVHVDYTDGSDYAQVTMDPSAPWNAQAGWDFGGAPIDLTGYTHLILDFETISITSGSIDFYVTSTETYIDGEETKERTYSNAVPSAEGRVVVDLRQFTAEELASIKMLSIWVWDPDEYTAVFNVKSVSLYSDDSTFPLAELGALWGNILTVDYELGDEYAAVTMPGNDPWATQVGWNYEAAPKDLTGYTHLVLDYIPVSIVTGNVEIVVSTSASGKELKSSVSNTANRIVVDLRQFSPEELASVKMISILVWDGFAGDANVAILNIKSLFLLADDSNFPLISLGALLKHTTVSVDYEVGNDYSELIFAPTGGYWEAQAGWSFEAAPLDFTGYNQLVMEFEAISVLGNILFEASSTLNNKNVSVNVLSTENKAIIDLTDFSSDELASIKLASIMIFDDENDTSVLRVKKVYLRNNITVNLDMVNDLNYQIDIYTISGIKIYTNVMLNDVINELETGIYIAGGKKIFIQK